MATPAPNTDPGEGRRVLFVSDQWGYGTATIAMAVSADLDRRADRWFAGSGPGFELARRSSFDGFVETDTMAERPTEDLLAAVRRSDVVVSVMNLSVARAAAGAAIPCVYVDSLLWMWPEPPEVPDVTAYFQEAFPGAETRMDEWRDRLPRPQLVGPIIARRPVRPDAERDGILVNFGGLSCSFLDPDSLVAYAQTMAECVVESLAGWEGPVVVSAGGHVLERLERAPLEAMRPGIRLVDLGHEEYLCQLERSRLLITSAGMHAIYEAFACQVPCLCLPAQNLSQALALQVLEQRRVSVPLDWSRLYGLSGLDPADEQQACLRIVDCVRRFSGDPLRRSLLVEHIRGFLADDVMREAVSRQTGFFEELGELGAPRIAGHVLGLLSRSAGQEPAPLPALLPQPAS